jgi:hypothetical protein
VWRPPAVLTGSHCLESHGNLALTVLSGNNVQIDYTGTWEHDSFGG